MNQFTFGEVKFPAPGSNLHSIAQQGVVGLFKFWDEQTGSEERWAEDWASPYWFLKYVQDYFEVDPSKLERADHEAMPNGTKAVAEILEQARGVYYFVFGEDGKTFVADFVDQDRVTVATMSRHARILCQDYKRADWTREFLEDLRQHQEGVLTDLKNHVDTITILH
jgi:hypothetical protein